MRLNQAIEELSTALMRDLLACIEPFKITDKDDVSNVYVEREWRMYGHLENFAPESVHEVIVSQEFRESA